MGKAIAAELQKFDVPLWALSSLGKTIRLAKTWRDGNRCFLAGETGYFDGITTCKDQTKRALIVFDSDRVEALTDVPFEYIEEPNSPLNAFDHIPGRAGQIAVLWSLGYDLRKHVPRETFYRYRRELLRFSLDITRPFVSLSFAKPQ